MNVDKQTIYVLVRGYDHEGGDAIGCYSTLDKAEAAQKLVEQKIIAERERLGFKRLKRDPLGPNYLEIYEFELDGELDEGKGD